jgi:GNAT superfamily N-acetyltransferase
LPVLEVRPLGPDEWFEWRAVRLAALAESPDAFTTRLSEWQGHGDAEQRWRDRLAAVPFNVVAHLGGQTVGMVSAIPHPDERSVELLSLWVAPETRGAGVGGALVGAVVDWARDRRAESLVLRVIEGNAPAEGLYLRHGLRPTGELGTGERGREIVMARAL